MSCLRASRTSSALNATRSRTATSATRRFQPRSIRRVSGTAITDIGCSSKVVRRREVHVDDRVGEENHTEAEDGKNRDARPFPSAPVEPEQQGIDDERQKRPG